MPNFKLSENFYNFAVVPDWDGFINYLTTFADPENWGEKNIVLKNYINHTFMKLYADYQKADTNEKNNIIYIDDKTICFNTGLFTKNYEEIYGLFSPNTTPSASKPWVFKGFYTSANLTRLPILPKRAVYFKSVDDVILDVSKEISCNVTHILSDAKNKDRLPSSIRNAQNLNMLFEGAICIAKKRVQTNFKVAVPQYYKGKIQLLLPLALLNPTVPDLALTLSRVQDRYIGHTCLSLKMAYNNARLLAKPESTWLVI